MNFQTPTLLLIEDFSIDRERYRRYLLADCSDYRLLEADTASEGLSLCRTQKIDAVLVDYSLPDADGLQFLRSLQAQSNGDSPPVVIVTGVGNERIAVQAIKLGAEDYLVKRDLTPEILQGTMRSAIENTRLRLRLQQSDDRFHVSIESMLDCFAVCVAIRDAAGQIVDFRFDYMNQAALQDNRMLPADLDKTLCEVFPAVHEAGLFQAYCRVVETGEPLIQENLVYSDAFGGEPMTRIYDIRVNKLDDGFVVSWRDVTHRKQAEDALQAAHQQITTIWESMTDAYITIDREWQVTYANSAAAQVIQQLTGLEPAAFLGMRYWDLFPTLVGQTIDESFHKAMNQQVPVHFEVWYEPSDNWFEVHAYPFAAGLGIYFRDITDRKRTEAERAQAEATLQQREAIIQQQFTELENIYATAPVGLCINDADLRFVRVNDRLAEINGVSIADHIGRTPREVLPELADAVEPLYRQVLASGEPILNIEIHAATKAQPGVDHDWLASYYPLKGADGQTFGVNVVVQDVTQIKQTQAALRESQALFAAFMRYCPTAAYIKDEAGRYIYVNTLAEQLCRQSLADFAGKTDFDLFPLQQAQQWHDHDLSVLRTNQPIEAIETQQQAGGDRTFLSFKFPIQLSPQRRLLGGLSLDITDRTQAEQRLQESEARLQLGVQVAGLAIAHIDYGSNQVTLSPEAAALYGFPAHQTLVSREQLHATFHPDDRQDLLQRIETMLQPQSIGWFAREHRIVRQNGEIRWINVRERVFFDAADHELRPDYAILAAIDITERKQIELDRAHLLAQAEAAREAAEAANRSKDHFVSLVAHELRSPLNAIMGWAKLLQTRQLNPETTQKALETITRNTQAQVQLVEDLLDLSRMVRGTLQLRFAPVNLIEVVEASLETVRPIAEAKKLHLVQQIEAVPPIQGDFNRLQQVVLNLLTNAIKFTPEGGKIAVLLTHNPAGVQLQVKDTGKGIRADFLPQLFEQFSQDEHNPAAKQGLGLGLAIVKYIVTHHGGTIAAESDGEGQGATFTVMLPCGGE